MGDGVEWNESEKARAIRVWGLVFEEVGVERGRRGVGLGLELQCQQ